MIVDVSTFNGEVDIWDIHYNVLKNHVDEFRVIAFDKTFSGKSKEVIYPKEVNWDKYTKAKFYLNTEYQYGKYLEMAQQSPNTVGADHWKLEFAQKESIKDMLGDLSDDDLVFIGDVDEIWHPRIKRYHSFPMKLKLQVYTYYLNNKSSEQFWGTLVAPWGILKDKCLNHMRTRAPKGKSLMGWHFTSMGGAEKLQEKLTDSYTQESYATPTVLENVAYNIENNRDFLGRDFTYSISEEQWPTYLKDHKSEYTHLLREKSAPQNTEVN